MIKLKDLLNLNEGAKMIDLVRLYNKALKIVPGSPAQKKVKREINKLRKILMPTEATTRWSGLSLSDTQIPAVATRQRKDVEKLLKKLRIPIKPHEVKGAPQRTIYAMDKKHIMTFVKAMDNADMFWYIPMGGSSGPRSKIGKPIK